MIRSSGGSRTPGERVALMIRRHRRLLAAGLLALAVLCVVRALQPAPAKTTAIVVAAADLPSGHMIESSDVTTTGWPTAVANGSAFTTTESAVGRITSGPLARGEPIGASRIVGPGLLALDTAGADPPSGARGDSKGAVAAPVRLADAGEAALLKPGDFVDVLAATAPGVGGGGTREAGEVRTVANSVQVIVVPDSTSGTGGGLLGGGSRAPTRTGEADSMVVLAVDSATASALAGAAATSRLSVVLRPPPTVGGR
ncbi:MAG: Flp pilus assembly protein CpaB [Actinomycetes bacterium]